MKNATRLVTVEPVKKQTGSIPGIPEDQTWTQTNLDVTHFRNGDPIPEAASAKAWMEAARLRKPAFCYYHNDSENGRLFGKLYNWYAVNDPRGLAPEGYHIPSVAEWVRCIQKLGGKHHAGGRLKEKGLQHWMAPNNTLNCATTIYARPGGFRMPDGRFAGLGYMGCWWALPLSYEDNSFANSYTLFAEHTSIAENYEEKGSGMSVRCIQDDWLL